MFFFRELGLQFLDKVRVGFQVGRFKFLMVTGKGEIQFSCLVFRRGFDFIGLTIQRVLEWIYVIWFFWNWIILEIIWERVLRFVEMEWFIQDIFRRLRDIGVIQGCWIGSFRFFGFGFIMTYVVLLSLRFCFWDVEYVRQVFFICFFMRVGRLVFIEFRVLGYKFYFFRFI